MSDVSFYLWQMASVGKTSNKVTFKVDFNINIRLIFPGILEIQAKFMWNKTVGEFLIVKMEEQKK